MTSDQKIRSLFTVHWSLKVGFPIRKSSDQSAFAAPRGLSQRTTSFIASQRQGIHRMPFVHLIAPMTHARPSRRKDATRPRQRRALPHSAHGRAILPMPPRRTARSDTRPETTMPAEARAPTIHDRHLCRTRPADRSCDRSGVPDASILFTMSNIATEAEASRRTLLST